MYFFFNQNFHLGECSVEQFPEQGAFMQHAGIMARPGVANDHIAYKKARIHIEL